MLKRTYAWSVIGGLLVVFHAEAFTLNGSSSLIGWEQEELSIAYNTTLCASQGDRIVGAFDSATEIWNGVNTAGIKLSRGPTSTTTSGTAYNRGALDPPVLICDSSLGTTVGTSTNNIAGVGIGLSRDGGLQINYGYLLLNATSGEAGDVARLSDTTLNVVVAHELGHVLGLGHTDDKTALMYFNASDKKTTSLGQDDRDGITYLYPRGELLGGSTPFGCGRSKPGAAFSGPQIRDACLQLAGFFALIAITVWFYRRPRRWVMESQTASRSRERPST